MKRVFLAIIALLLPLVLSACGGGVYELAYTARGDSTNVIGLTKTNQFQSTDDLNVVVKLKSHNDPVEVSVEFFDPAGNAEGDVLKTVANKEVGSVVLGLDWEARPSKENWQSGSWKAIVSIDGEKLEELSFRVN